MELGVELDNQGARALIAHVGDRYEPAACWVVWRYDDVKCVCQDQEAFSTSYGATLGPQFAAVAEVHGSGDLADRTAARDRP